MKVRDIIRRWKYPVLWTLLIFSGVPTGRLISDFTARWVDLNLWIGPILFFFAALAVIRSFKNKKLTPAARFQLLLLAIGFTATFLLPTQPLEKIHFIEYFGLVVLIKRSLDSGGLPYPNGYLICFGLGLFVGIADEIFQWFIPNRVFSLMDILVNTAGCLFGIAYLKITEQHFKIGG